MSQLSPAQNLPIYTIAPIPPIQTAYHNYAPPINTNYNEHTMNDNEDSIHPPSLYTELDSTPLTTSMHNSTFWQNITRYTPFSKKYFPHFTPPHTAVPGLFILDLHNRQQRQLAGQNYIKSLKNNQNPHRSKPSVFTRAQRLLCNYLSSQHDGQIDFFSLFSSNLYSSVIHQQLTRLQKTLFTHYSSVRRKLDEVSCINAVSDHPTIANPLTLEWGMNNNNFIFSAPEHSPNLTSIPLITNCLKFPLSPEMYSKSLYSHGITVRCALLPSLSLHQYYTLFNLFILTHDIILHQHAAELAKQPEESRPKPLLDNTWFLGPVQFFSTHPVVLPPNQHALTLRVPVHSLLSATTTDQPTNLLDILHANSPSCLHTPLPVSLLPCPAPERPPNAPVSPFSDPLLDKFTSQKCTEHSRFAQCTCCVLIGVGDFRSAMYDDFLTPTPAKRTFSRETKQLSLAFVFDYQRQYFQQIQGKTNVGASDPSILLKNTSNVMKTQLPTLLQALSAYMRHSVVIKDYQELFKQCTDPENRAFAKIIQNTLSSKSTYQFSTLTTIKPVFTKLTHTKTTHTGMNDSDVSNDSDSDDSDDSDSSSDDDSEDSDKNKNIQNIIIPKSRNITDYNNQLLPLDHTISVHAPPIATISTNFTISTRLISSNEKHPNFLTTLSTKNRFYTMPLTLPTALTLILLAVTKSYGTTSPNDILIPYLINLEEKRAKIPIEIGEFLSNAINSETIPILSEYLSRVTVNIPPIFTLFTKKCLNIPRDGIKIIEKPVFGKIIGISRVNYVSDIKAGLPKWYTVSPSETLPKFWANLLSAPLSLPTIPHVLVEIDSGCFAYELNQWTSPSPLSTSTATTTSQKSHQFQKISLHIPIELCTIARDQLYRIDVPPDSPAGILYQTFSRRHPRDNFYLSQALATLLPARALSRIFSLPKPQDFLGLESFSARMLQQPSIFTGPASPVSSQKDISTVQTPTGGKWTTYNSTLLQQGRVSSMLVLFSTIAPQSVVVQFLGQLITTAAKLGLFIDYNAVTLVPVESPMHCRDVLLASFTQKRSNSLTPLPFDLVLAFCPGSSDSFYPIVKQLCDCYVGVPSQCVAINNILKSKYCTHRTDGQENLTETTHKWPYPLLSNICLKINAKLGNVNFQPSCTTPVYSLLSTPTLILGIDCDHTYKIIGKRVERAFKGHERFNNSVHAAPAEGIFPSHSCVVGNRDLAGMKWAGVAQQQGCGEEIMPIEQLSHAVYRHIIMFKRSTGFIPRRIVVYRDGLGEVEAQAVVDQELHAIMNTCLAIHPQYQPQIICMLVVKRHNLRFFAPVKINPTQHSITPQFDVKNPPVGTVIDDHVTRHGVPEFYLYGHSTDSAEHDAASINDMKISTSGTARPVLYQVLVNTSLLHPNTAHHISTKQLIELTYYLSFSQQITPNSSAVVIPVQHADKMCGRVRYWSNFFSLSNIVQRTTQSFPNIANGKFTPSQLHDIPRLIDTLRNDHLSNSPINWFDVNLWTATLHPHLFEIPFYL